MSQGTPKLPAVNSLEDYQNNLTQIERARKLLDTYSAMNEEARSTLEHEQDLARKIAEGEKARQELERLRNANSLALIAPAPASTLQPAYPSPNSMYPHAIARSEGTPAYGGYSEQQNVQPSMVHSQIQVDQRHTHAPGSYPQNSFTRLGVQQQGQLATGSGYHYYRPEVLHQAVDQSRQAFTSQSPMPAQYTQSIQPTQTGNAPTYNYAIYQTTHPSHAPQQNRQYQSQQWQQQIQAASTHQRAPASQALPQQTPGQDHLRKATVPRDNGQFNKGPFSYSESVKPNTLGNSLPVSTSSSTLNGELQPARVERPDTSKWSSANNAAASTTTSEHSYAPSSAQPQLYQPASEDRNFQLLSDSDLYRYLHALHPAWTKEMPPNSYYVIPNTKYMIYKRSDHSIQFVYSKRGNDLVAQDLDRLLGRTQPNGFPFVATPQGKPESAALEMTRPAALPTSQATISGQSSIVPGQQAAGAPVKLPPPISTIQPTLPAQPQQMIQIQGPANQEQARTTPSVALPKRVPADADKRRLARDIIRALGTKRPQPFDSLRFQATERPAKRHEPEVVAQALPSPQGTPGSQPSRPIQPSAAPIDHSSISSNMPLTSGGTPVVQMSSANLTSVPNIPPAERELQQNNVNVASSMDPTLGMPAPMDVDEVAVQDEPTKPTSPLPSAQDETVVQGSADETTTELNRLSLQEEEEEEEEQALHAHIEEVEEGEIEGAGIEEQGSSETRMQEATEEGEIQPTEEPKGDEDREGEPQGPIKEIQPEIKIPLFLPSPSPSPQRDTPRQSIPGGIYPPPGSRESDRDTSLADSSREEAAMRGQHLKTQHRAPRRMECYVLVPPLPPHFRKYKEQEAKRRKRRKLSTQQTDEDDRIQYNPLPSESDTSDPVAQLTVKNSTTRLAEKRCRWSGCDAVLNSSQNLLKHLRQIHCAPNYSKRYIVCYWSGCGNPVANARIEEHLTSHTFFPLLCAYQDCDESFRMVQSLMKHNDSKHTLDVLKSDTQPFTPTLRELPPIPHKVPAFLIKSGLVRQKPMSDARHHSFGPWVFNNIAGPVKVTKRYNAAKSKPPEYGISQSSSMQFSTNPSRPAKLRDLGNLTSVEVSEMVSEGLVIWPPSQTPKTPRTPSSVVAVRSEEDKLMETTMVATPTQPKESDGLHVSSMAYQSSEEEAVETMLTGQLSG